MSVGFHICPSHGLVYIRYTGCVRIDQSLEVLKSVWNHDHARPGQKQLIDFSEITSFERDYARLFEMQSEKAASFVAGEFETVLVYYVTSPIGTELAQISARIWEEIPGVATRIATRESEALEILGVDKDGLAPFRAKVAIATTEPS